MSEELQNALSVQLLLLRELESPNPNIFKTFCFLKNLKDLSIYFWYVTFCNLNMSILLLNGQNRR